VGRNELENKTHCSRYHRSSNNYNHKIINGTITLTSTYGIENRLSYFC